MTVRGGRTKPPLMIPIQITHKQKKGTDTLGVMNLGTILVSVGQPGRFITNYIQHIEHMCSSLKFKRIPFNSDVNYNLYHMSLLYCSYLKLFRDITTH